MKTQPPVTAEAPDRVPNVVRAWDRFWFSPRDPTGLAVIRIFAGALILYIHIAYSFGLLSYVGPESWLDDGLMKWIRTEWPNFGTTPDWKGSAFQPSPVAFKGQSIISWFFEVRDPAWIVVIHVGTLGAMFLLTIGFCTRIASVLTWLGALSYIERSLTTVFGMDAMMMVVLMYLMISPCGAALSVDRLLHDWRERRRHGPGWTPPPPAPSVGANFAIRMFQVHFCFIYLASGFSKLLGSSWWSGLAPMYVFMNTEFAPFNVPLYRDGLKFLVRHRWLFETLMNLQVLFTLVVEIGLPFLIWNRHLRWVMICASVLLHTGIGLFMGLVTFSLMMLIMLLAFVPPEVMRRIVAGLGDQTRQLFPDRAESAATRPTPLVLSR
jgi:hypothetical protein